eukprot:m.46239 g.46239  ORF g.46239 m.46239 type:complete len:725 (+) comp10718_c0_seq1:48-2222(+)
MGKKHKKEKEKKHNKKEKKRKKEKGRGDGVEDDERPLLMQTTATSSASYSSFSTSRGRDVDVESAPLRPHNQRRKGKWNRAASRASQFFGIDGDDNTCDEGMMILNEVNKNRAHMNKVWFHGRLSRETTERKLQERIRENGIFLIRQNSSGDYVLSMVCKRQIYHFPIAAAPQYFMLGKTGPKFRTLIVLVDEFHDTRYGLPCCLKDSVSRKKTFMKNMSKRFSGRGKVTFTEHYNDGFVDGNKRRNKQEGKRKMPVYEELLDSDQETECYRSKQTSHTSSSSSSSSSSRPKQTKRGNKSKRHNSEKDKEGVVVARGKKYEVVALDSHTPIFVTLISIIQVAVVILLLIQSKFNVRSISFIPDVVTQDIQMGFSLQPVPLTYTTPINVFIGPDSAMLVKSGAKYNPCMRKDTAVFAELAHEYERELEYGCCVLDESGFESCGMVKQEDCPPSASFLGQGQACPTTCGEYRLRPCCTGVNGTCAVTTRDYCRFIRGIWNDEAALCSEISCIDQSCGFSMSNPDKPNQWYRFFLSIFIHAGVIHVVIVFIFQLNFAVMVEKKVGFLRMFLMYTIACFGGNLVSGVFSPQLPGLGAAGGILGTLAIYLVDLFASWRVQQAPCKKLFFALFGIVFFFILGTLPWVDNYAHLGGFVFGLLGAAVFLPYVSFGTGDRWRKRIVVIICFLLLVGGVLVGLVIFYRVQTPNICPSCDVFQCYNWVENLCDST